MFQPGLLPFRAPPLPQEMLSSWIVRLCLGLGCQLQPFTIKVLGATMFLWNSDVDRQVPEQVVLGLNRYTGYAPELVQGLTLQSYAGTIFKDGAKSGPLRWVLPVLDHLWKTQMVGMQFCADCLAEDKIPYFRKFWRLAFFTFCPRHQKFLQEGCPKCGVPPMPTRRDFLVNPDVVVPLHVCAACLTDLRKGSPTASLGKQDAAHRAYTHFLIRVEDADFGPDLDLRFFDRLHKQTSGFLGSRRGDPFAGRQPRITAQNGTVRERYTKISPWIVSL